MIIELFKIIAIIVLAIIAIILLAFLGCCIKAFWTCNIPKKKDYGYMYPVKVTYDSHNPQKSTIVVE